LTHNTNSKNNTTTTEKDSNKMSTNDKIKSADVGLLTKMKEKISLVYACFRDDLAKRILLPHLPSIVRPHIETLTSQLNSMASSHLQSPITDEDVVLLGFMLHAFPSLFLLIRYTNILSVSAEIYCTFVYPFIQTIQALEQRRHDLTGHFVSFWLLLCFMSIFEYVFNLRYYFHYYLAMKCLVSYCMVDPKQQWILVWDGVVLYPYILPKLGFGNGATNRTELMKKEVEEKENAFMKKVEPTAKMTTATTDLPKEETPKEETPKEERENIDETGDNISEKKNESVAPNAVVDTDSKKEDGTRDDSPISDMSEYSFVDLAEVESKLQVELVSVTLKVSDITAEKLTAFNSDEDVERPYLIFDIVESEDVGHAHEGQGKKYKTAEGALVEEEEEELVTENEPELVVEKDEETKETATTEDDEPTAESNEKEGNEGEAPKTDDGEKDTDDTSEKEGIVTTTELPTTEPKKKSVSFTWEGQVISVPTKIRPLTENAPSTTNSPEDVTSSFLRISVFDKCVIGNDAFVGMSHLKISDLVEGQGETYKLSLSNEKAPEDFNSGELAMSIVSE